MGLSKEEVSIDSRWLNDLKGSPYCEVEGESRRVPKCRDSYIYYRSADGSCNNLKHPDWGQSFTPYRRSHPPDYGDGKIFV